ncbi:hypothetical protein [Streptomyces sp. NBC_00470]|uniref:hypothetical protein n=1 Tax=Streptomyces sp. NBC_00470 TaxID=2975753 RepID=UPI002F913D6F
MPDTDRLYALSSTHTSAYLDGDGPALLVNDPVVAMRWYLTTEQEDRLAVSGLSSDDDGRTWQECPPAELFADAGRALDQRTQPSEPNGHHVAQLQRDALAAEAADWLDDRIRYTPPGDPRPSRSHTPSLVSWKRGGQIWALTLGTIPDERVVARLAARYAEPQPEASEWIFTGARDTLEALALAEAADRAHVNDLLAAHSYLGRLTLGPATGQLRGRAHQAQRTLMDSLVARHPHTAPVAHNHPDPQHPAHQAARDYLRRLSLLSPTAQEFLRDGAVRDFTEALAAAEQAPYPPEARAEAAEPAAVPGYPLRLAGDLQAAAQWRLLSPSAQHAAEYSMANLAAAESALTTTQAGADTELPPGPLENQALRWRTDVHQELTELNSRHALLMHASVLADAEKAAEQARQHAIATAARAIDVTHDRPVTTGAEPSGHEAFMTQVHAAEHRIARTLETQRLLTRDAMHRLFPQTAHSSSLHDLRARLIDHSGLGIDAEFEASRAVVAAEDRLARLLAPAREGTVDPGRAPGSEQERAAARETVREAESAFRDLERSRAMTLRAVRVLDGAAGLEPSSSDAAAALGARIAEQSRRRAQRTGPTAPRHEPAAQQQRFGPQGVQAPGARLP